MIIFQPNGLNPYYLQRLLMWQVKEMIEIWRRGDDRRWWRGDRLWREMVEDDEEEAVEDNEEEKIEYGEDVKMEDDGRL